MSTQQWQARWIWLPNAPEQAQTTLQFRRVFNWTPPGPARLLISASHIYRVYMNGKPVGRGPDRADPRWPYYDVYDVTSLLHEGANVLCGLAHHVRPHGDQRMWCLYNGAPGLLAQLETAGKILTASDRSWRMRPAPGWQNCAETINRFRSYRHVVDLSELPELQAAYQSDYDDTGWTPAAEYPFAPEGPLPHPIPREIPPLQSVPHEPVGVSITGPQDNTVENPIGLRGRPGAGDTVVHPVAEGAWITLDFGRPMGGFPVLELAAEGTGTLDIYSGEGHLCYLTDRLLLSPAGNLRYEPLDWRGGQSLKLHFRDLTAPVRVQSARFVEMVYPFETRGAFQCADETLTGTWRVCRETAWAGVKDHPVDCLNREQALWLTDVVVHNRALAACFGDVRPTIKAVRQALRVMTPAGIVPVPGPAGQGYCLDGPVLNWSEQPLSIPLILADVHRFDPDTRLAEFALPYLERMFAHFQRYENARGLISTRQNGLPDLKCFGGWNPMLKHGVTCAFNFEYAMALRAAAELARAATGADASALAWENRAEKIVQTARETFWDTGRRLFVDGEEEGKRLTQFSTTANAWAALGGGLLPTEAGAWAEALRTATDIMPPLTPFDATLLLEAYLRFDLELHARHLLDEYWGAIIRQGHPTLPECWHSGYRGGLQFRSIASSLCHPYGAGPAYLCLHYILGARPLEPGWRRVLIRPRTLGLPWAQGRIPTPLGELEIAWERRDSGWELEVRLPAGMAAEVNLPRLSWGRERLTIDRREVWRVDGSQEYLDQLERRYTAKGPREARTILQEAGRHVVVLESI